MAESVGGQSWRKSTQAIGTKIIDNGKKSPTTQCQQKNSRNSSTPNNNQASVNHKTMPSTSSGPSNKAKVKREDGTTSSKNSAKRETLSPTLSTSPTSSKAISLQPPATPKKTHLNQINSHTESSSTSVISKNGSNQSQDKQNRQNQSKVNNNIDNDNLRRDFEILTKDANESRQRTRRLQSELDEKNEIILLLRDELEVIQKQNDKLERESRQLTLEVKKFKGLQDELDELKGRQLADSNLELELSRLKERAVEFDFANTRIKELEDTLGNVHKVRQQVEKELDEARDKLSQNATEISNLEREFNKSQTKFLGLESERNSFEEKLLESLDREARLQANNKQAEEEIRRLQTLVKSYEEKRDEEEANNSLIMSVSDLALLDDNNQYSHQNLTINQSNLKREINLDDKQNVAKHDNSDMSIKFELDKQLKFELNEENVSLKKHISEQEGEIKNLIKLNEKQKTQIELNKELISTLRRDLACEKTLANKLDKRLALMSRQIKSLDDSRTRNGVDLDTKKEVQDESSLMNISVKTSSSAEVPKIQQVIIESCKTNNITDKQGHLNEKSSKNDCLSSLENRESSVNRKPNLIVHVKTRSPSSNVLAMDSSFKLDPETRHQSKSDATKVIVPGSETVLITGHETNNVEHDDLTNERIRPEATNSESDCNVPTKAHKLVISPSTSIYDHDRSGSSNNDADLVFNRTDYCDKSQMAAHPLIGVFKDDSTQSIIEKSNLMDSRSEVGSPARNNNKINSKNNNEDNDTTSAIFSSKHHQIQHDQQEAELNDNLTPSSRSTYQQTSNSPSSNARSQSSSPLTTITIGHDSGFQSINQERGLPKHGYIREKDAVSFAFSNSLSEDQTDHMNS